MIPRKCAMTSLMHFFSLGVILFSNCLSLTTALICGFTKIHSFIFASERVGNLLARYLQQSLSLSSAFTNCFITPTFICRSGKRIFLRSSRLPFIMSYYLVFKVFFWATVFVSNVCLSPYYPTCTNNMDIL